MSNVYEAAKRRREGKYGGLLGKKFASAAGTKAPTTPSLKSKPKKGGK
jgi:hypothetical protein